MNKYSKKSSLPHNIEYYLLLIAVGGGAVLTLSGYFDEVMSFIRVYFIEIIGLSLISISVPVIYLFRKTIQENNTPQQPKPPVLEDQSDGSKISEDLILKINRLEEENAQLRQNLRTSTE